MPIQKSTLYQWFYLLVREKKNSLGLYMVYVDYILSLLGHVAKINIYWYGRLLAEPRFKASQLSIFYLLCHNDEKFFLTSSLFV